MLLKVNLLGNVRMVYGDYYKPSLYIPIGISCNWKCAIDGGFDKSMCQNSSVKTNIEVSVEKLLEKISKNKLANGIIFSGLEAFDNFEQMSMIIEKIKDMGKDIIVYTGYNECEIQEEVQELRKIADVIIKFGRYVPNSKSKLDDVLGIHLSSDNQYAVKFNKI